MAEVCTSSGISEWCNLGDLTSEKCAMQLAELQDENKVLVDQKTKLEVRMGL